MKNLLFLLLLLFSFNSCNNKESLIYDSKSLDSLVSKYVDNGSQALLLVRLEDRNGQRQYIKTASRIISLFQIILLIKTRGLEFGL